VGEVCGGGVRGVEKGGGVGREGRGGGGARGEGRTCVRARAVWAV
jgi:hypothetical protein